MDFDYSKIVGWTEEQIRSGVYHDYSNTKIVKDTRKQDRRYKIFPGGKIKYTYWVWEKCYGTQAPFNLIIHHKDENPLNDNIENLTLMTRGEHSKWHSQRLVGKTYDEIHGAEKAEVIRQRIIDNTKEALASPEMRQKISETTKEGMIGVKIWCEGGHLPEEVKAKISESRSGKCMGADNPSFGKPCPEKTKEAVSKANTGRAPWNKGKKISLERPDIIENQKKSHADMKGENNPFYGQKQSEELKKHLAAINTKHQIGDVWRDEKGILKYKNEAGRNRRVPDIFNRIPEFIKDKVKEARQ